MNESDYNRARTVALELLKPIDNPRLEDIQREVKSALAACKVAGDRHSTQRLVLDIEASLDIWVGSISALDNSRDHVDWISQTMSPIVRDRTPIQWQFWSRYEAYLKTEKKWSPNVLRSLDRTTTAILQRIEDPTRGGAWDRRGMVVGSVQSGKTSNFIGLISKAVDAGYKLIVVLTGLHNNLRSQTQFRLDDDLLGFDTDQTLRFDRANTRIGVGKLRGYRFLRINSLTSSSETGDFNQRVAQQAGIVPGGDPILFVVKKNVSVLDNLNMWVRSRVGGDDGIIHNLPLIVIDDECDQASINTKVLDLNNPEHNVTAINEQIRRLLNRFEQVAYVGYTATPFATVFIHPDAHHATHGDDIFPESFVISLPNPSNYVGPLEVFGIDQDDDLGFASRPGLPILRPRHDNAIGVDDHSSFVPDDHDRSLHVGPLPPSLRQAIRAFILSCAARAARGSPNVHNSMLIHVSRFVDVQDQISDLVTEELKEIQRRLRYGDGKSKDNIRSLLRDGWEQDYLPTSASMDKTLPQTSWKQIESFIEPAAAKIVIKTIHGGIADVLDYRTHKDTGLSVIVIGGDKLSRGLTLEGLTVSYYLRASKMYDTLLQMGRWFGYKDGYGDLCRIYTTSELMEWYRWIAMAGEELRQDFIHMQNVGATPRDFGLRVRRHPGSLMITSINKMRAGTKMQLSYADTMNETLVYHRDPAVARANFDLVERFLMGLGEPTNTKASSDRSVSYRRVWGQVQAKPVIALLRNFQTHPEARRARGDLMANYISKQNEHGDLCEWTVALLGRDRTASPAKDAKVAGGSTPCIVRHPPDELVLPDRIGLKRLVDPKHEGIDLSRQEWDTALAETVRSWKAQAAGASGSKRKRRETPPEVPSPPKIRETRSPKRGLLLLYPIDPVASRWGDLDGPVFGFAVSFPASPNASAIDYVVNKVYRDEIA